MKHEYDEAKSRKNFEERGIDFEFASRIFDGDYIEQQGDSVFVVVFACRAGRRRIISARRANRRERDVYNKAINKGTR